jgi:hypothetical protein
MIWLLSLPLSFRQKARRTIHRKIEKEKQLAFRRGGREGRGKEPNHTDGEKAWSSVILYMKFSLV